MSSFDHLAYLRVFEGCNLHCDHCFIPQNPKRMTLDQVAAAPVAIAEKVGSGKRVEMRWHGGEPTLVGADWMRRAIEAVNANHSGLTITHSIQTNLMTYSEEWRQLFRDHFESEIGVSWDPVIRHLRVAGEKSNSAYETAFANRLSEAVADGMAICLVVTVTRPLVEGFSPVALLDRFSEWGVKTVSFERVTPTGEAKKNWDTVGLNNAEHSEFMMKMFRAYKLMQKSGRISCWVAPFDGLSGAMAGSRNAPVCFSGGCDDTFHTIDAGGYKKGCTALTAEVENRRVQSNAFVVVNFSAARSGRVGVAGCHNCRFKGVVCNSGCLASSPEDGSGECSGFRRLLTEIERFEKERKGNDLV